LKGGLGGATTEDRIQKEGQRQESSANAEMSFSLSEESSVCILQQKHIFPSRTFF
jgi:hypothetical protein